MHPSRTVVTDPNEFLLRYTSLTDIWSIDNISGLSSFGPYKLQGLWALVNLFLLKMEPEKYLEYWEF